MKKIIIGIIVVVVLAVIYGFSTYNSLVTLNVNADAQWKQVETLYQRRLDLIPNVVNSVKGAMKQEETVFTTIADARTRYAGATTVNEKAAAANQVESAFARLLVVMEQYPELKSVEIVKSLMIELEGSENRIAVERGRFNEAVKMYNLKVMRIPSSIVASLTGFETREYFEAEAGAEKAPVVNF